MFSESKAIFLLDGLDELPLSRLKEAVNYLRLISQEFPHLQVVTTGSPGNLDGLLSLGFFPVTIADWNDNDRVQFIQNWGQSWKNLIIPEISQKSSIENPDPIFIDNWVNPHETHLTPLEWTLNIWAVYSGEGGKPGPFNALETYISRYLPDASARDSLQKLALELVKNARSGFSQSEIGNSFSQLSNSQSQLFDPSAAQGEGSQKQEETDVQTNKFPYHQNGSITRTERVDQ